MANLFVELYGTHKEKHCAIFLASARGLWKCARGTKTIGVFA